MKLDYLVLSCLLPVFTNLQIDEAATQYADY